MTDIAFLFNDDDDDDDDDEGESGDLDVVDILPGIWCNIIALRMTQGNTFLDEAEDRCVDVVSGLPIRKALWKVDL